MVASRSFRFILAISLVFTFAVSNAGDAAQYSSLYYGSDLCAHPGFHCVAVKKGDTWERLFPDPHEREMVKRLNRTNMSLSIRPWILVPQNLDQIDYFDLSPFPVQIGPVFQEKVLLVNLNVQAFGAYDAAGKLVHWGPISSGRGFCSDINQTCTTAVGSFRVSYKKGVDCFSEKFPVETKGGAPMPYCMYYYRGFALHASTLPGYPASHGCIRLLAQDAKWLNTVFLETGSKVIVNNE